MVTGTASQFGHETSTPPRKRSTRTVAQRKVYGKKRNNAPRAMFDPKSPARLPQQSQEGEDSVESIQVKLAEVSLNEEPVTVQEIDLKLPPSSEPEKQKNEETSHSKSHESQISSIPSPCIRATPNEIHPKPKPAKKKTYQTMVEVQICAERSQKPATVTVEKEREFLTPESDQTKRDETKISDTKTNETKNSETKINDTKTNETKADDTEVDQTKIDKTPSKKAPKAQKPSGYIHDSKANDYVRPILNEALSSISSENVQQFDAWASHSAATFHVAKLAEGSYGEVYKFHLHEEGKRPAVSKSKLKKLKAYGDGVFKVVPLRAQKGLGSKKFTTIDEIVSEVKMLKYLDPIPGFARFREIHVVQGRFPEAFQTAWDHYKKTKDDCLNPNPANKKAYPDTQLWAIIEMDDAGCELEKFAWSSVFQIYDIFWGVAMALARAEEYALFEHRDLHLGNVCIRSTRPNGSMHSPTDMEIAGESSPSGFGISRLETTIIDYSLSRADLRLGDLPDDPNGIIENASSDLDKKQIFDAIGQDDDEVLLRDTYRFMRATLYTGNPLETQKTADIPGIWAEYAPRTNLVWLLFILKNLMKNRKPEAAQRESTPVPTPQRKALATRSPNQAIERQTKGTNEQTSAEVILRARQSKGLQASAEQLREKLEERLSAVLGLLDLENGHEDMCCAADLVAYAMDSQWLAQQDFF